MSRADVSEREIHAGGYTYKNIGTEEKPKYVREDRTQVYTSDYSYMLKFDRFCKDDFKFCSECGADMREGAEYDV